MSRTKAELLARCEELGIDTSSLANNDEREAAIKAKEAELAAKVEAEKKSDKTDTNSEESDTKTAENDTKSTEAVTESKEPEASKEKTETPEQPNEGGEAPKELQTSNEDPAKTKEGSQDQTQEEKKPDHYEDDRGRKWKFKANAPKKLRIDGHPMSQEEILATEEVISELVLGNCSFLTQIIE
ncbi:prolipoprotein diacylglyceryl transferase [Zunongwangia atlantica]|uniref:Uncharacterized protein n=1 Tax=Zunongwangia atlantica 22II14-10F7 TaxID=1185767 RepID=A0A1Y1SZF1_9FLAO|nr:hypothetical protein [Zunongwangia atlantica]ORL43784.1 hypothetical protein IIF7_19069 [Zunongwangia atlantica 22II14-10F7]